MRIPNTIFDRELIEICAIHRSEDGETDEPVFFEKDENRNPILDDNGQKIPLGIPIEILEPERPDYIFPHAEAISAPTHIGIILEPIILDSVGNPQKISDIQKEDIIHRTGKHLTEKDSEAKFPRLFIINLYVESGVQILELEQTMI